MPTTERERTTQEPTTANERLVQAMILHALLYERLGRSHANATSNLLRSRFFPRIETAIRRSLLDYPYSPRLIRETRAARAAMKERLRRVTSTMSDEVEDLWRSLLTETGRAEADFTVKALRDALPVSAREIVTIHAPAAAAILRVWSSYPVQGATLVQWARSLRPSLIDAIDRTILVGFGNRMKIEDITRSIIGTKASEYTTGVLGKTIANATSAITTGTTLVSARAREEVLIRNRDLFQGVRWVSVLDTRTSLTCIDLDGRVFPVGEGPRPPAHFNCRSIVVPIYRSWRSPSFPDEIPDDARPALSGDTPEPMTYKVWLRAQTNAVQDDVLGPTRARLFRLGRLQRFTDRNYQPLTVAEIRDREGLPRLASVR